METKWMHFTNNTFNFIFLNEIVLTPIKISLKFVDKCPINIIPALAQIMALHHPGDKPLSEPMMVNLPMHICVTRSQWVNKSIKNTWFPCQDHYKHFGISFSPFNNSFQIGGFEELITINSHANRQFRQCFTHKYSLVLNIGLSPVKELRLIEVNQFQLPSFRKINFCGMELFNINDII